MNPVAAPALATLPPLRAFPVTVTRLQRLSPHFLRVTFADPSLRCFAAAQDGNTWDLRVKLLFPHPGCSLPDMPELMARGGGAWYQQWRALDERTRGHMRTYTVRQRRVECGELDIDFVVDHPGPADGVGPAARWAQLAAVGDTLQLIGPHTQAPFCVGIEYAPRQAREVLLMGDETAVPAITSIVERTEPAVQVHAFVEVPHTEDFLDVRVPPGSSIQWFARSERTRGRALEAALRQHAPHGVSEDGAPVSEIDIDAQLLWEAPSLAQGQVYAWVAGEAGIVKNLRGYCRTQLGMARSQAAFMGYWRCGRPEGSLRH